MFHMERRSRNMLITIIIIIITTVILTHSSTGRQAEPVRDQGTFEVQHFRCGLCHHPFQTGGHVFPAFIVWNPNHRCLT